MNQSLQSLKPERLWFYFGEVLKIPRPSKKEEKIIEYLVAFGKRNNLETIRDKVGNVIIRKAAAPGLEKAPSVCLQGHVDMVCEKDTEVDFDFNRDPIQAYVEDGWLKARGTTLGADNGIAVATMLAILEAKDIAHGPLECLFTIDEETGLTGAFALEPGLLKSRTLLNLDSEDDGEFFIGCAGGKDTVIELPMEKDKIPKSCKALRMRVHGLQGGHSGDDIHRNRANANKVLNRFLWETAGKFGTRVSSFDGGNLRNAIPREAVGIFVVPAEQLQAVKSFAVSYLKNLRYEFRVAEPDMKIDLEDCEMPGYVLAKSQQEKLLGSLYACPHGVMAWSQDIPGFVETSTNLASVKMKDVKILIATSQRSSIESAKDDICQMVAAVFKLTGAKIEHTDGYPGWSPNPDSKVLGLCVQSYEALFGKKPVVRAIHAGLECGIIGDKYPGMDMISFGPTMRGVHSPSERLEISTVEKFLDSNA